MSKIALEHGATIDKYVGDAILAFFGDPDTRGVREDALACVRMAIAMQTTHARAPVGVVGFRHGEALPAADWYQYGLLHSRQLRKRRSYGLHDNRRRSELGIRLQSHADVGGILIAHETYSLVKDDIQTEELQPVQVKGFAKPIRTYRILDIYTDLIEKPNIVRHQQDGIRIEIDLARLSPDDHPLIVRVVERLLSRLNEHGRTD